MQYNCCKFDLMQFLIACADIENDLYFFYNAFYIMVLFSLMLPEITDDRICITITIAFSYRSLTMQLSFLFY